MTGGKYYRADNANASRHLREIDKLEKTEAT